MKLTKKDKRYLLHIGYIQEDLTEIENVSKYIRCKLCIFGNTVRNVKRAYISDYLSRETYISGLARATFHKTAVRPIDKMDISNTAIFFDRIK